MPIPVEDLPRYYDYRQVLALLFDGDEAAFADAWVRGQLPPAVRQACLSTMGERTLEILLLARMCRSLDRLIQVLQEGDLTVFDTPTSHAPQ